MRNRERDSGDLISVPAVLLVPFAVLDLLDLLVSSSPCVFYLKTYEEKETWIRIYCSLFRC